MDAGIGRLFEQLKRTGKDRDTVVIFSSDSGPHQEGGHSPRTQHSGVWPVREKR